MADLRDLSAQLLAAAPLTPGLGAVVQGDPSEFLLQFEDGTHPAIDRAGNNPQSAKCDFPEGQATDYSEKKNGALCKDGDGRHCAEANEVLLYVICVHSCLLIQGCSRGAVDAVNAW